VHSLNKFLFWKQSHQYKHRQTHRQTDTWMEMLKTVPRYAVSRVKTRKELTGSDDEDEVRFSAEAT